MKALVIFSGGGEPSHPLAFLLKKNFRHCGVAVQTGDYWVMLDGERGVPAVTVVSSASFDLATFYRAEGFTVVETEQRDRPSWAPFLVANCVGLVVGVLCLRTWAITPHQLYLHLTKDKRP